MPVDSFKYLPRIIASFYKMTDCRPNFPIPWTPVPGPLSDCAFGLITSGGLYHRDLEPPFDVEREKLEPTWGDPTYRTIPTEVRQSDIEASHLHINTRDVLADMNILLPVHRFQTLAQEGAIGGLAKHAYSLMGYQGFPSDCAAWRNTFGPQLAQKLKMDGAHCVLLTPA